jgi:hypothetical protein
MPAKTTPTTAKATPAAPDRAALVEATQKRTYGLLTKNQCELATAEQLQRVLDALDALPPRRKPTTSTAAPTPLKQLTTAAMTWLLQQPQIAGKPIAIEAAQNGTGVVIRAADARYELKHAGGSYTLTACGKGA